MPRHRRVATRCQRLSTRDAGAGDPKLSRHTRCSPVHMIGSGTATASAALYGSLATGRVRGLSGCSPRSRTSAGQAQRSVTTGPLIAARGRRHVPDGPVSGQRWYSNAMRESMTAEVYAAYGHRSHRRRSQRIYHVSLCPPCSVLPRTGRREKRRSRWPVSCPLPRFNGL